MFNCQLPVGIIKTFDTINSVIFHGNNHSLPSDLISWFLSLKEKRKHTQNEVKKIMETILSYLSSIKYITLLDDNEILDESISKLPKVQHECSTLPKFINKIKLYTNDLQCFKRLHAFLHWEYNKYYIPFIHDSIKIGNLINNNDKIAYSPRNLFDIDQLSEQCKWVSDLHNLCYQLGPILIFTGDKNEEINKKNEIKELTVKAQLVLNTIDEVFIKVINQYRRQDERDFLKMFLKIYTFFYDQVSLNITIIR